MREGILTIKDHLIKTNFINCPECKGESKDCVKCNGNGYTKIKLRGKYKTHEWIKKNEKRIYIRRWRNNILCS